MSVANLEGRRYDLFDEQEVRNMAAAMVVYLAEQTLYGVVDSIPYGNRRPFFEAFLCALTGMACATIGGEEAKGMLVEVERALASVAAQKAGAHAKH